MVFVETRSNYIRSTVAVAFVATLLFLALFTKSLDALILPIPALLTEAVHMNKFEIAKICAIEATSHLEQIPYEISGLCIHPAIGASIIQEMRSSLNILSSLFMAVFGLVVAWRMYVLGVPYINQIISLFICSLFPAVFVFLIVLLGFPKTKFQTLPPAQPMSK